MRACDFGRIEPHATTFPPPLAQLGFHTTEMSFENVTAGLCSAVKSTLSEAHRATQNDAIRHPESCKLKTGHTGTSHRWRALEQRVGQEAAALINGQLAGTPYAWMLDLSAVRWPQGEVPWDISARRVPPAPS